MKKIIQILHHSLTPFNLGVDPRFYEGDWHVRLAKELVKRTKEYEVECWRPEKTFTKVFVRKDKNGITYKIFPSTCWTYALEYSLPLLKNLQMELAKHEKMIVHLHGFYNFHANLISLFIHKRCPVVAQSHGGYPLLFEFKKNIQAQFLHPQRFPFLFTQQISFSNIDRFFVLSKEEEEYFSKLYGKERVRIQPMGIDLEEFKPIDKNEARERLHLDKDRPYVLYVGRLHESKGIQYLIEALKYVKGENPYLKLILVGDGPHKEKFKAMSKSMGIGENVTFTGWVKPYELLLYYSAVDIFVFPSLDEPWGVVVLEALACQKPVITTFTGCVPKLADALKDGLFIIPKASALPIKKAISQILLRVEEISRKISREKIRKYSWDDIIKNTLNTYEELLYEYYN
jgi:glycosyltransferase involved in cell wall biosynthesis